LEAGLTELSKPIQKIVIVGAECSGKTSLAKALAQHYNTVWVPEYLRDFVAQHQRTPKEHEQIEIARMQVQREAELLPQANQFLFCDTSPLMIRLYSEHYFGKADLPLFELAASHTYDFTLLTSPDFAWVDDGLQRESPAVRQRIHDKLQQELEEREIPHLLLAGGMQERLDQVAFAMDFLIGA